MSVSFQGSIFWPLPDSIFEFELTFPVDTKHSVQQLADSMTTPSSSKTIFSKCGSWSSSLNFISFSGSDEDPILCQYFSNVKCVLVVLHSPLIRCYTGSNWSQFDTQTMKTWYALDYWDWIFDYKCYSYGGINKGKIAEIEHENDC